MSSDHETLERMSREELIARARVLGVERAELMTRVELRDEIVRRSESDLVKRERARGWLGVARDLVASVVEAGFNLPDAAKAIRGDGRLDSQWKGPPPVATVTLAEIYAAQGHLDRALTTLDEVLRAEPDHEAAQSLRARLIAESGSPTRSGIGDRRAPWQQVERPFERIPTIFESEPTAAAADSSSHSSPAATDRDAVPAEPAPVHISDAVPATEPSLAPEPPPVFFSPFPEPAPPPEPAPFLAAAAADDNADSPNPAADPFPILAPDPSAAAAPDPAPSPSPSPSPSPDLPAASASAASDNGSSSIVPEVRPVARTVPSPGAEASHPGLGPLEAELSASVSIAHASIEPGVVTVSVAKRHFVYWELGFGLLDALRRRAPTGRGVVRLVGFRPGRTDAERFTRDILADGSVGGVFTDIGTDVVLRAALGWQQGDQFWPIAVGSEVELSEPGAAPRVRYRPRAAALEHYAAAEARAIERLALAGDPLASVGSGV